jgi:hypothetical protein
MVRARSRWARIEASGPVREMRPGRCASLAASAGERASRCAPARARSWPADANAFARLVCAAPASERGEVGHMVMMDRWLSGSGRVSR